MLIEVCVLICQKAEIRETYLELQRLECVPLTVSEQQIAHIDFRARAAIQKARKLVKNCA
jgi:hypothetical protein